MEDSLQLRRLSGPDAAAMAELERECFTLPWSREQCLGALGQKAFGAFGIFDGSALVGYLSFYHTLPEVEIVNLAVATQRRRQGLGRRLLRLLLQVARKMGMQRVSLEVRQGNFAAIGLYTEAGFNQVGRRKAYYPDTGEDALVMIRELQPTEESI